VKDGPFAGYTLKLGPGLLVTEHCIARGVNDTKSVFTNSSVVAYTLSLPTFEQFTVALDGGGGPVGGPQNLGLHGGGHGLVGGEMTNFFLEPWR
jgi:tyrosinase